MNICESHCYSEKTKITLNNFLHTSGKNIIDKPVEKWFNGAGDQYAYGAKGCFWNTAFVYFQRKPNKDGITAQNHRPICKYDGKRRSVDPLRFLRRCLKIDLDPISSLLKKITETNKNNLAKGMRRNEKIEDQIEMLQTQLDQYATSLQHLQTLERENDEILSNFESTEPPTAKTAIELIQNLMKNIEDNHSQDGENTICPSVKTSLKAEFARMESWLTKVYEESEKRPDCPDDKLKSEADWGKCKDDHHAHHRKFKGQLSYGARWFKHFPAFQGYMRFSAEGMIAHRYEKAIGNGLNMDDILADFNEDAQAHKIDILLEAQVKQAVQCTSDLFVEENKADRSFDFKFCKFQGWAYYAGTSISSHII